VVSIGVRSKVISPLISSATLGRYLEESKLTLGTSGPHTFSIWNGRENDIYLTDLHEKWLAAESFLIKLERPDGRLKLLSPRFKWSMGPISGLCQRPSAGKKTPSVPCPCSRPL
jgi:hypothetical protein